MFLREGAGHAQQSLQAKFAHEARCRRHGLGEHHRRRLGESSQGCTMSDRHQVHPRTWPAHEMPARLRNQSCEAQPRHPVQAPEDIEGERSTSHRTNHAKPAGDFPGHEVFARAAGVEVDSERLTQVRV